MLQAHYCTTYCNYSTYGIAINKLIHIIYIKYINNSCQFCFSK